MNQLRHELRGPDGRYEPRYVTDSFDPRGWGCPMRYTRLWINPEANLFAIVDLEDYAWAQQFCWGVTYDKHGKKAYATRGTSCGGRDFKIYLHKEILTRATLRAPSVKHIIGDHLNGHSLDDRRCNLRWATPSMNSYNRGGSYYRQLQLPV